MRRFRNRPGRRQQPSSPGPGERQARRSGPGRVAQAAQPTPLSKGGSRICSSVVGRRCRGVGWPRAYGRRPLERRDGMLTRSGTDREQHDFVVVGPAEHLARAGFVVEGGEYGAIPHLYECPSSSPGLRPSNRTGSSASRSLSRACCGTRGEAAFVSLVDGGVVHGRLCLLSHRVAVRRVDRLLARVCRSGWALRVHEAIYTDPDLACQGRRGLGRQGPASSARASCALELTSSFW